MPKRKVTGKTPGWSDVAREASARARGVKWGGHPGSSATSSATSAARKPVGVRARRLHEDRRIIRDQVAARKWLQNAEKGKSPAARPGIFREYMKKKKAIAPRRGAEPGAKASEKSINRATAKQNSQWLGRRPGDTHADMPALHRARSNARARSATQGPPTAAQAAARKRLDQQAAEAKRKREAGEKARRELGDQLSEAYRKRKKK